MEFVFLLHKAASGVRLSFSAGTLVNVGNYENVRREVSMQVDVDERGMSAEEREATVRDVFESLHGCVTSMLAAAVGEAVPEDHELASPARRAEYDARRAARRAEREKRKRMHEEALKSALMQTESCADCADVRGRRGGGICDHHDEVFAAIKQEFGPKSEDVPY